MEAAPLCGLRECSAEASLYVLGDDAHVRVQEEGLQLPVNPLLHLGPVQGCRIDLCLYGPALTHTTGGLQLAAWHTGAENTLPLWADACAHTCIRTFRRLGRSKRG